MEHERVQVPINVAVEKPRTRVVSDEADRDIIFTSEAHVHDVAEDRVLKVIRRITSTADNGERMTMQVNWMLCSNR